jgi:hypothetical protein
MEDDLVPGAIVTDYLEIQMANRDNSQTNDLFQAGYHV